MSITHTSTHPLRAGTAPATLWTLGELAWVLSRPLALYGLFLVFLIHAQHTPGALPLAGTAVVAVGAYALLFGYRRARRAAMFRTPGGLAPEGAGAPPRRDLPSWAVSVLGHALGIATVAVLAGSGAGRTPYLYPGPPTTVAQVFLGLVLAVAATSVLVQAARGAWCVGRRRSWTAAAPNVIALCGNTVLLVVTGFIAEPATVQAVLSYAPPLILMVLAIWGTVAAVAARLGKQPTVEGPSAPAVAILTWWRGTATLDDRQRYGTWIDRALVAVPLTLAALALIAGAATH